MRRRPLLVTAVILAAAAAAVGGAGYALARRVPVFYAAALTADNAPPGAAAGEALTRLSDLRTAVVTGASKWGDSFTADELNALLRDNLEAGGMLAGLLPDPVAAPRVAIDGDRLFIGARVQVAPAGLASDATTTVLSVELRPWVTPEPNVVAVEVCGVWAGGLPVNSQRYLDQFSDALRDANSGVTVTWYRVNGNPVAVLKLYAGQRQPPAVVRTLRVADGKLTIGGQAGGS